MIHSFLSHLRTSSSERTAHLFLTSGLLPVSVQLHVTREIDGPVSRDLCAALPRSVPAVEDLLPICRNMIDPIISHYINSKLQLQPLIYVTVKTDLKESVLVGKK